MSDLDNAEQGYHEILADIKELLLLVLNVVFPGPVSPIEILFAAIEALIADAYAAAPNLPGDARGNLSRAEHDPDAAKARADLARVISNALQEAKIIASRDPNASSLPSRWRLGELLSEINDHAMHLTSPAGAPTNDRSVPTLDGRSVPTSVTRTSVAGTTRWRPAGPGGRTFQRDTGGDGRSRGRER